MVVPREASRPIARLRDETSGASPTKESMKCPHCSRRVGLFSEDLKEIGKTRVCPACGNRVKMGLIHSRFAAGFVPVALLAILFGVSGPFAAGIAGGVGAAVGLGLKRAEA